jgi:hemerythrin
MAVKKQQHEHNLRNPAKKTDYVKWSNTYSVGIRELDNQHKKLLNFVNELFNHISDDEADESAHFKEVIDEVVDYVKVHFATEEKIMRAINFPGYAEHKKAHEAFVLSILKTVRDFENGKRLVLINFTNFLRNWILSHIAIIDVKYSNYLKRMANRKTGSNVLTFFISVFCRLR